MKKIIVAGGGHGGIAAASILAKNGYDVTVYEKHKRDGMGYDWTDIFNRHGLEAAQLPMPDKDKYEIKGDVIFYGPSGNTAFVQRSPKNQPEIKMERRDIYNLLIENAEKNGVKFKYGVTVKSAKLAGDRVTGIVTDKGTFTADMVIDACGCDSPVRKTLPDCCGIQKEMKDYDKFYIYRAFFNRKEKDTVENAFKLTLFSNGNRGISWVTTNDEYTDVLIGRFFPFDKAEAKRSIDLIREKNPAIGKKIVRGGSFAQIPVRQNLSIMVCDGYAAVGDSAFMAIPLIGSGIANALRAGGIIADVIMKDETETYSAETLWDYQKIYFKKYGVSCAALACFKNFLVKTEPESLDNIFDRGIDKFRDRISAISKIRGYETVKDVLELLLHGKTLVTDKALSKEIGAAAKKTAKLLVVARAMPKEYSRNEVIKWSQEYNRIFTV
ncbi:MAG: NAD(P)/FAD-dependent oxidoreductase [Ruminococcaceae bacterium]|nr:NAD(P)/FAD-dependent oxidoreductase [Oscillospiraceae bacterium]